MSPSDPAAIRHSAATSPDAEDPRLRRRTYAIPFARVWDAAIALASGGLSGWSLLSADDIAGVIEAEKVSNFLVTKRLSDVRVDVGLDENGQTRVDLHARSRDERADLGANRRAVAAFITALDDRLLTR